MRIFVETDRLILRELHPTDEIAMYEMDSDPEVHKYLGNDPVKDIGRVRFAIQSIRQQYVDNGIGRWAMVNKDTNAFMGWTGLKLIKDPTEGYDSHYDLGYRMMRKYWGQGFATESAIASVEYGFNVLNVAEINARAEVGNLASKNVLQKAGLKVVDTRDFDNIPHYFFSLLKADWERLKL